MDSDGSGSESDYIVEDYIRPEVIKKANNDESADLLGNFDDEKRQEILAGTRDESVDSSEAESINDGVSGDEDMSEEPTTKLSKDQLTSLMKGSGKSNRFVLYVTNLSDDTTKDDLNSLFSVAGEIKGIRRPEGRRTVHFAFVEMKTIEGFQAAFELHNTELKGKNIKVQISEGGKKKSANKKNILKQKNRKLAEMRHEPKAFNKPGKFYDKNIKKEIEKVMVNEKKKWRKFPNSKGGAGKK